MIMFYWFLLTHHLKLIPGQAESTQSLIVRFLARIFWYQREFVLAN